MGFWQGTCGSFRVFRQIVCVVYQPPSWWLASVPSANNIYSLDSDTKWAHHNLDLTLRGLVQGPKHFEFPARYRWSELKRRSRVVRRNFAHSVKCEDVRYICGLVRGMRTLRDLLLSTFSFPLSENRLRQLTRLSRSHVQGQSVCLESLLHTYTTRGKTAQTLQALR